MPEKVYRVGLGADRHRLAKGRPLMLGGVAIPSEVGEDGYSDGDALLHAIIDALLGAAGLGDVGELFPPGNPQYKDAASAGLLAEAWRKVSSCGWSLENIDCTIHIERPKLLPHRSEIISSIEEILRRAGCKDPRGRVFVKAKTAEGLGDVGEGRAVDTQAVCLLSRLSRD